MQNSVQQTRENAHSRDPSDTQKTCTPDLAEYMPLKITFYCLNVQKKLVIKLHWSKISIQHLIMTLKYCKKKILTCQQVTNSRKSFAITPSTSFQWPLNLSEHTSYIETESEYNRRCRQG